MSKLSAIEIQGRPLGEAEPCLLIAEMGLSHDGSLGAAHAFIDAVAARGVDAVKFQTHIAEAEGTAAEKFRSNVFMQDASRQDYWRRTAFSEEQWRELKRHADQRNLLFLSSPFSVEALELLQRVGCPAWKVASGETNNIPLLERMIETGKPVLLSSGMSTIEELDQSMALLQRHAVPRLLFQCTNRYPCPPEHVGLNMLAEYAERYGVPVGFSDHSGTPAAGIAARALGASAIEVHVTFHRACFGPDVVASITLEELDVLVSGVRFLDSARAFPVEKNVQAEELAEIRSLFQKSIVAREEIPAGAVLQIEQLAFKKPGTGIPAMQYREVIGRQVSRRIAPDEQLAWEDFVLSASAAADPKRG